MAQKQSAQLFVSLVSQLQATQGKQLTHKELADLLETTPSSISRLLQGKLAMRQVEWLIKLLALLPAERREVELKSFFR